MRKKLSKIITAICVFVGAVLYALFGYKPTAVEPTPTVNEPVQTEISIPVEQQTITAEASDAFYAQEGLEIPARIQQRSERIMERTNYTVSFNTKWNIPNWVAWDITKEEINNDRYERNDFFVEDPDISASKAVRYSDYSGSGYDRGHMCPAGDNHHDATAMDECFYMTNICPQDHELNKETWNDLEIACRQWARRYGKVYVVCGPIVNDADNPKKIGRRHKVVVPDAFFKVIMVVNNDTPQAIGYIFQNNSSKKPWKAYSVDEVEAITGIDFFPALPDGIENMLEANYEEGFWRWN